MRLSQYFISFCAFGIGSVSLAAVGNRIVGEFENFTMPETTLIYYGANSSFVQKSVLGKASCTNEFFQKDPLPGVRKACHLASAVTPVTPQPGIIPEVGTPTVAREGQIFTVKAGSLVFYGSGTKFVLKLVSGSGLCTNAFFAKDPAVGILKACYSTGLIDVTKAAPKIMMVGDSITEAGSETRIRLAQRLQSDGKHFEFVGSMMNANIRHEGHSGWTTADIDREIPNWMRAQNPDVVMIMIGTNDVLRNQSLSDAVKNVGSIISKIQSFRKDTVVFVAKILPNGVGTAAQVPVYNAALENSLKARISAGEKIILVDMNTGFSNADLLDGIHPGGSGLQKMGDRWYDYLKVADYPDK